MKEPVLALNNPQWLICHKTKPNQTKPKVKIHPKNKIRGRRAS